MAREEESDGTELLLQPLGRQPWLDFGHSQRALRRTVAERELERTALLGLMRALRLAQHATDRGKSARAVALQRIEGAGSGETFQDAPVDGTRIDAGREVGEVGEGTIAPRRNDRLNSLRADTFERGERVMDGVTVDL